MEECTQSLGDFIEMCGKEYGSLSRSTILNVLWGSSNGLHYLHFENNLIHGDIKSFNILIKGNFVYDELTIMRAQSFGLLFCYIMNNHDLGTFITAVISLVSAKMLNIINLSFDKTELV